MEVKAERKLSEVEDQIERRAHAFEARQCARQRAAEEELEKKFRAAEDEIARLRQLERLRHAAAVERGERPQ